MDMLDKWYEEFQAAHKDKVSMYLVFQSGVTKGASNMRSRVMDKIQNVQLPDYGNQAVIDEMRNAVKNAVGPLSDIPME